MKEVEDFVGSHSFEDKTHHISLCLLLLYLNLLHGLHTEIVNLMILDGLIQSITRLPLDFMKNDFDCKRKYFKFCTIFYVLK